MDMIRITNNGDTKVFPKGTSFYEIGKAFNIPKTSLALKINNEIFSMHDKAIKDCTINFIDSTDLNGYKIYKAAFKFIFEVALKELMPNTEVEYEHSVPKGFLAEVINVDELSKKDLINIKSKMAEIVSDDIPFKKMNVKKKDAIEFYECRDLFEKQENIQNTLDKVVTLYELKGYYNYFYSDMPYSTGSITSYDIVKVGRNKLIFLMPTNYTNGALPEYVPCDSIITSYLLGKKWLELQNMKYVTNLNQMITTGKLKDFTNSCELVFNVGITKAVIEITANNDIKVILIAGPSSSGKTTTTKNIAGFLYAQGYDPIRISTDDFFLEREESPKDENGEYDFECLTALDLDLFNSTLKRLLNKEEVELPSFNFVSGKKEYHNNKVQMKDNSIILIEGLHTLNDDLTPSIDKKNKYKIYLSPFIPLSIDRHNYISSVDLRLLRRIARDNLFRGYPASDTIHSWQKVRNGEEKYIFPFINQANIIVNTALPYEIGVLKVYIEPLLRSIKVDSEYYEEARRLLNLLKMFYPISSEFVPSYSIIREFIGGTHD